MNPTVKLMTKATVYGFAAGWVAGTAIISAGKAYLVLTSSKQSVHHLLGHVGKPSFRRELAVAGAIYGLASTIVHSIGQSLNRPLKERHFFANAIALPLAFLAGALTTHESYTFTWRTLAFVVFALVSLDLIKKKFNHA